MSFLINWDLLAEGVEAEGLRGFLNSRFQEIERPPFLGPCEVTELDFGDIPPDIIIQDICDPSPEFYLPDDIDSWQHSIPPFSDDASASTPRSDLSWDGGYGYTGALGVGGGGAGSATPLSDHELALQYAESMRRESDAQVEVEIAYKGSMRLAISTELIVNQPTPAFMVLPLTLTLTGFHFTATAIVAYLGDRVNFCFKEADTGAALLRDVSIDSEVGDRHKQVLKNVGKIERFIVDQLRKVIQDFLVFPNHQTINLLREPSESDGSEMYKGSEPYDDDSFDGI
ncbi:hypothetical protein DFS34DRAFT_713929 [Phlyctochytrium arcticum]|nr:hypothetical protein DFS34DRAFT_713929 [Phlyctochytrium arcticum]